MMRKYLYTVRISLLEYLSYRINFLLWRFRSVLSILITYFLWHAVYVQSRNIFGYQREQMLTYVILVNLISSISQSTQTHKIGYEINNGNLCNYLLKPLSYIAHNFSRDLSDKLINIFSALIEIAVLLFLLKVPFFLQTNLDILLLFISACIISSILFFEINLLLSFIAFWSKDTMAPRFIFYILVAFLSGTYFPLDIFSKSVYQVLSYLPFTYLIFFPLKIYLGGLSMGFMLEGLAISSFWIFLLFIFAAFIWKKGLKIFTAEGR